MSLDHGWNNIPTPFIFKLIGILADPSNLVNVSRPATSILKRLVEADPRFAPSSHGAVSGSGKTLSTNKPPVLQIKSTPKLQEGIWSYGFDLVFDEMKSQGLRNSQVDAEEQEGRIPVLETVVQRLSSGDSMMAMDRCELPQKLQRHGLICIIQHASNQLAAQECDGHQMGRASKRT